MFRKQMLVLLGMSAAVAVLIVAWLHGPFLDTALPADESATLDINLRYNRNTLEQTVLAAVAWTGLALELPQDRLWIVPELAVLFAAGRAAFWIGYLMAPWARAFGLGLTFYPTVAAYLWLAGRLLS